MERYCRGATGSSWLVKATEQFFSTSRFVCLKYHHDQSMGQPHAKTRMLSRLTWCSSIKAGEMSTGSTNLW